MAPTQRDPAIAQLRWLFCLTLLPLVAITFKDDDVETRLVHTLKDHPDLAEKLKDPHSPYSTDDLLNDLPAHKIDGAWLSSTSWAHWLYAGMAAVVFWAFIIIAFPLGTATSTKLWTTGLFTGTVGILLLLGVQLAASFTGGHIIGGKGVIVWLVLRFIGFSYNAALDPNNGFILSMFGFTFGVGLCEELCKLLPLIWVYRKGGTLDLRGAVALGLATGIGFGVSEGITYSSDTYNGFSTGAIYIVRFVSCVALHAVWSASSGVFLWRAQQDIRGVESWQDWILPVGKIMAVSMILHGLYDTLLKRDLEIGALLTAIASFAWFFVIYEKGRKADDPSIRFVPA